MERGGTGYIKSGRIGKGPAGHIPAGEAGGNFTHNRTVWRQFDIPFRGAAVYPECTDSLSKNGDDTIQIFAVP